MHRVHIRDECVLGKHSPPSPKQLNKFRRRHEFKFGQYRSSKASQLKYYLTHALQLWRVRRNLPFDLYLKPNNHSNQVNIYIAHPATSWVRRDARNIPVILQF